MAVEEHWTNKGEIGIGKKAALVIVDLQKMFCDDSSPMLQNLTGFKLDQCVENTAKLAQVFRDKKLPVIHTTIAWRKDGQDTPYWKVKHLTDMMEPGSDWAGIYDEIAPEESDIVMAPRKVPSAFFGTELKMVLIKNCCDTVVITGANTSGCIRASTVESFSHGFRTILPEQCIGDLTGLDAHIQNLKDVHNRYADVVDLDTLIDRIKAL